MKHGFVKLAAAIPELALGMPEKNARQILSLMEEAFLAGVSVAVFPELCLTGYTCGDLFFTEPLLRRAREALLAAAAGTAGRDMLVFVGLPLLHGGKLYNCTAALSHGRILGIVPKTCPGNPSEARYFAPAPRGNSTVRLGDTEVPFGTELLFACENLPALTVRCAVGADSAADGNHGTSPAAVLAVPGASPEKVGAEAWRRMLAQSSSGRTISAYIYAGAGEGESTTDAVFSGHSLIAANGEILAENPPFGDRCLVTAIVDLQHLQYDRCRQPHTAVRPEETVNIPFRAAEHTHNLAGVVCPSPFLPGTEAEKAAVCGRILEIQSRGLARRLKASRAKGAVIALSGGLDSTLALIVTVRAMDLLGRDRREILSVTMPCFGTTGRTRSNAEELARGFGTDFRCIDIQEAVDLHFRDIGHDGADHSVVYENAQARERTQIIMDLANRDGSLVIGTGDLSELALGWATYNGDHMSNYGVNGGVPKTLVRHIVACYADLCQRKGKAHLADVLRDILDTPVSPELLPPQDGDIAQRTEDIVGPYDLHDFFLYHFVRWGEEPEKIRREAIDAFRDRFSAETVDKWLAVFLRRFFTQQFKRSALPDGPGVGSVALSPREDWHMPSDVFPWSL